MSQPVWNGVSPDINSELDLSLFRGQRAAALAGRGPQTSAFLPLARFARLGFAQGRSSRRGFAPFCVGKGVWPTVWAVWAVWPSVGSVGLPFTAAKQDSA